MNLNNHNNLNNQEEVLVELEQLPQKFAQFFDSKVRDIINYVTIDNSVYTGTPKVNSTNTSVMDKESICQRFKFLTMKSTEGYDITMENGKDSTSIQKKVTQIIE
jgi:hypothetical protein